MRSPITRLTLVLLVLFVASPWARATKMPAAPTDIFDRMIPRGMVARPDRYRQINAIWVVKITGDGGGVWTLDMTADPPTCVRGDSTKAAHMTMEVPTEAFMTMLRDPNAGMQYYFQGILKITGDPMQAMRFKEILDLCEPDE